MKTLYIIGNGFDVAHNLGTSYGDFHDWLMETGRSYFVENMEMFFSHWDREGQRDQLWFDFERALGACDFEETYSIFANQSREYFGEGYEYLRDIRNTSDEHFIMPLTYEMPKLFMEWITSINAKIANIKQKNLLIQNITDSDLFLNFNFTDTLEQAYGVLYPQVCHIHNRVSAKETPIVGHNQTFTIEVPGDMTMDEIKLKQSLADVLNGYKKDYKTNIANNSGFYRQIDEQVTTLCFYGHSLGSIDLPYFKDIKKRVSSGAQWIFYIYQGENGQFLERNKKAVLEFIKKMHLDKQQCKAFDSKIMNQGIAL
jgi:hypothetical protein